MHAHAVARRGAEQKGGVASRARVGAQPRDPRAHGHNGRNACRHPAALRDHRRDHVAQRTAVGAWCTPWRRLLRDRKVEHAVAKKIHVANGRALRQIVEYSQPLKLQQERKRAEQDAQTVEERLQAAKLTEAAAREQEEAADLARVSLEKKRELEDRIAKRASMLR